jgi:FtsP/CotA-like multicopper oxidase with cupredoxin domain
MSESRRDFLRKGAAAALGLAAAPALAQHEGHSMGHPPEDAATPRITRSTPATPATPTGPRGRDAREGKSYVPVLAPDVATMPWEWDGNVKVFHMTCDVVQTPIVPWRTFNTWGYNGSTPGPTIEVVEGDRVRIVVDNNLPEGTTLHWHGLEVPIGMDGVEGISQDLIAPGGRFVYEFTLRQNGTFFYHSHRPMQQMLGMIGLFIVHPRKPHEPRVDRDFAFVLQEWAALPSNPTPNTLAMEFNWLTMNGRSAPATTPVLCKLGERVRLRFVNLGMDHHPMHMHGHTWVVTGTEGGRLPRTLWRPGNTELVGVAQARDTEFVADNPGDWMLHCHLPHHMMNSMISMVGPISNPGGGMPAGHGMEEGMGMLHGGHALDEDFGPSLGRTLGVDAEQATAHAPMGSGDPHAGHTMDHSGHGGAAGVHPHLGPVAPNAREVPGFPQDMFMAMDSEVEKPETYGLRPGWTGAMMGMMTLIRVVEPALWDKIAALQAEQRERLAASQQAGTPAGGAR